MNTNDDQQTPATYVHTSSTADTPAPAKQAAAAAMTGYETDRAYSSVEMSRKVKAQGRYQADLVTAVETFMTEYAAEHQSPTVATLLNLAQSYTRATTDAHREYLAAEVAEDVGLAEAGTIRRAAKAVELGMPGIICRARATGMTPGDIARELGATPSYVRRVLRDNPTLLVEAGRLARGAEPTTEAPAAPAPADTFQDQLHAEMVRHDQATAAARSRAARAHNSGTRPTNADRPLDVAEENSAAEWSAFWTIQRWEGDYWHELAAQSTTTTARPNDFARARLDQARQLETGPVRLRCRVWTFGESEGAPLAEATTD